MTTCSFTYNSVLNKSCTIYNLHPMGYFIVKSGSLRDEHYCQVIILTSDQIAPVKDTHTHTQTQTHNPNPTKQKNPNQTKNPNHHFFSASLLYFSLAEAQRIAQQALHQPQKETPYRLKEQMSFQPFNHCFFCQDCKDNRKLTQMWWQFSEMNCCLLGDKFRHS